MAHNLSINSNGEAEFFVAKTPAWHGLGTVTDNCLTWENAVIAAKLDWTISKSMLKNPRTGDDIGTFGIFRDDNNEFLALCKERYNLLQNQILFSFADILASSGRANFESAGAIDGGKTVWCMLRLSNLDFSPVNGDLHEARLLCIDYRDGRATTFKVVLNRVVCQNTLSIALGETGNETLKFRHTALRDVKMKQAEGLVSMAANSIQAMNMKLKALAAKPVSPIQFKQVMEKLFPNFEKETTAGNKALLVANNFMLNDGNKIAGIQGTAYAMLQAVTDYIDHQKIGLKGEGSMEEKRRESALFGSGDKFKNDALKEIENMFLDDIDMMMNEAILSAV